MTNEAIIKQIEGKNLADKMLNIHFKQRNTVTGLFIRTSDFDELKSKNLWRIVTKLHVDEWRKTKDINLCRIFNGTEFTRLSEVD
ncbi:MAG: short-chain dehydrogenase [Bacteroidetes bacterium]|nr:MAG: short-chain dehydrogenase [Bacteroidota bacterium]